MRRVPHVKKIITIVIFLFALYQVLQNPQIAPQAPKQETLGNKITPVIASPTQPFATQSPTHILEEKKPPLGVSAQVLRVVDGDTVHVLLNSEEKKVRLIGIDTPETVDPRKAIQCFGKEASNYAKELLTGQTVYLESDESQANVDKYQRLLRYIWLADGTNFNMKMIAEGYAFEYTYAVPYKYQEDFVQAQEEAQLAKKGLWGQDTCAGGR